MEIDVHLHICNLYAVAILVPSSHSIMNFSLFIAYIFIIYSPISTCRKSKRCSKSPNHRGLCNSQKQTHKFWEKSPIYNFKANQGEVIRQREEVQSKEASLHATDYQISLKRQELEDLAKHTEEQTSAAS